jgi:hypothetical protein
MNKIFTFWSHIKNIAGTNVIIVLLSLSISIVSAGDLNTVTWKKSYEKNGIEIFHQTDVEDAIVAMRGKTIIDAPLEKIISILLEPDYNRRKDWFENLLEYKLMSQPSPLKRILKITVDVPWPLKDRDFVYTADLATFPDKKTVILSYKSINNIVAEQKGLIRGTMQAIFNFKSIKGGEKTLLDLKTVVNPKGKISVGLINFVQKDFAFDMISNLRNLSVNPEILVLAEFQDIMTKRSLMRLCSSSRMKDYTPMGCLTTQPRGR